MVQINWMAGGAVALLALAFYAGYAITNRGPSRDELPPVSAPHPVLRVLPEKPRTYYQYVDEAGEVRFVPTLHQVPEAWRAKAGRVEIAALPPDSPAMSRALRKLGQERPAQN